jgi:hypothetical protein
MLNNDVVDDNEKPLDLKIATVFHGWVVYLTNDGQCKVSDNKDKFDLELALALEYMAGDEIPRPVLNELEYFFYKSVPMPASIALAKCESYLLDLYQYIDKLDMAKSYIENVISPLRKIANEGVCISGNVRYGEINPYTSIGRPSHKVDNINLMAIPHTSRGIYNSRYDNGCIITIDFQAFHIQLIMNMMGMKCTTDPYKMAFPDLERDEAKQHLIKNLFSKYPTKDFQESDLGKFVIKLQDDVYEHYIDNGYVLTKLGRRMTPAFVTSKSQLFAHYMQSLETETHCQILSKAIKRSNVAPQLYQFDSVVLDCKKSDVPKILNDYIDEYSQEYAIKVTIGHTFENQINSRVYYPST